jgi:hypothetical protein
MTETGMVHLKAKAAFRLPLPETPASAFQGQGFVPDLWPEDRVSSRRTAKLIHALKSPAAWGASPSATPPVSLQRQAPSVR